MVSKQGTVVL